MKLQIKSQQEITGTFLCIIGLLFIVLAFFIFASKCDRSVVLGAIIGCAASILNEFLAILTRQLAAKYDAKKANVVILLAYGVRVLFMSTIVLIILLLPALHDITGILALFFPLLSRAILARIRA